MGVGDVELSRAVSHALRHEPWLYELELDEQGWVDVDQLLAALRSRGPAWADLDEGALAGMVERSDKKRHQLQDGRVRAGYGHSVPGRVRLDPHAPPPTLFHGTAPSVWEAVQHGGLRPMGRQYVHLSSDTGMAEAVGRRKDPAPVVLVVDAAGAARAGVVFYRGAERVWLADAVPAAFVAHPGG